MSKINELIQTLCPDGVEYKKLGEVAEYAKGRIPATDVDENTYVGVDNLLQNCRGVKESTNVPADGTVIQFLKKDILIGNIRPYLKKAWLADRDGGTNGDVLAIRVKDENEISPDFLYVILSSDAFFAYDMLYSKGAKMPRGDKNAVMMYELPVPPLPVQEEIVRILDEYTRLEAELEAKLSEEIELKQKQYEYCASKLFEDLNVEYISMSELAKFKYGYTDKASDSGNARFIRITDIDDFGELSSADEKYITLTDDAEKYLLTKGSLVVARTGATYGKTLYFDSDEPSVYASFLIKIDFDNNQVFNRYYWHFTKTSLYWEQANKYVKVGGQQQFNSPALGRVCVPVPSITEQERIVKILDKYDTYTRDMISTLNTELEFRKKQYVYYRDQLLTFKRKEV